MASGDSRKLPHNKGKFPGDAQYRPPMKNGPTVQITTRYGGIKHSLSTNADVDKMLKTAAGAEVRPIAKQLLDAGRPDLARRTLINGVSRNGIKGALYFAREAWEEKLVMGGYEERTTGGPMREYKK